eukprot:TRINITY_DN539_c0_g2_i3.p1 TRINITY_DN539_c0_g2~~TRINITY_DN539_c0_g2_i3.p1  ORF type:complete len:935 (-),score=183.67 TRINITY_DN539_c0_g2_i3:2046-4850(-)
MSERAHLTSDLLLAGSVQHEGGEDSNSQSKWRAAAAGRVALRVAFASYLVVAALALVRTLLFCVLLGWSLERALVVIPAAAWGVVSLLLLDQLPFYAFTPGSGVTGAYTLGSVWCRGTFRTADEKTGLLDTLTPPGPVSTVVLLVWHALDVVIACIAAFVSFGIAAAFAVEPSGVVSDGWQGLYALCIICVVVAIVSAVANLVPVVALVVTWIVTRCSCARHCGGTPCRTCRSGTADRWSDEGTHSLGCLRWECANKRRVTAGGILTLVWRVAMLLVLVGVALTTIVPAVAFVAQTTPGQSNYEGCDMVDPEMCALPFPSTFFLKQDNTTATGFRVNFGEKTLPKTRVGFISAKKYNQFDGFSVAGGLLCFFDDVAAPADSGPSNVSAYFASPNASTVIVDAETGERVPHWVEMDGLDTDRPLMILQPARPLRYATRYVVGVRFLKTKKNGTPVPRSEYFAQLMSSPNSGDRGEYLRQNVLPILERDGWEDSDIILAWDFVTMSSDGTVGRLKRMRDAAQAALQAGDVGFDVYKVTNHDCGAHGATVGRTIWGKFFAPKFVSKTRGGELLSGPYDEPVVHSGKLPVQFVVEIPCSLIADPTPSFMLQYGHGLFFDRVEVQSSWVREVANSNRYITFATDWYGFSRFDILTLLRVILNNPSHISEITESVLQAHVNADLMLQLMRSDLGHSKHLLVNNHTVVDTDAFGFYGLSLGAILGGAYVGMSSTLTRSVLGSVGSPFSMVIPRSALFTTLEPLFGATFFKKQDVRFFLNLMQMQLDAAEVSGWLTSMDKSIFLQTAVNDPIVSTFGAQFVARGINAQLVQPAPRTVWGLQTYNAPTTNDNATECVAIVPSEKHDKKQEPTSYYGEWLYSNVPEVPQDSKPADWKSDPDGPSNPHMCLREEAWGEEQVFNFLVNGALCMYCPAPYCTNECHC